MIQRKYELSFATPAFLGNAAQKAQWRTPPIKALLRQWWRVAYTLDKRFAVRVDEMRHEEGILFGNAWLEGNFSKSLVRLRLDRWSEGTLKSWQALPTINHPEVRNPVGSDLYLGYGPLKFENRAVLLKAHAAIQSGESAMLSLAVPDESAQSIECALWMMDRYATLGGRSRNGWGSFTLKPCNGAPALNGQIPAKFWIDCLDRDWPHAMGQDEKGALVWKTQAFDDWKAALKRLAEIKIGLRTLFKFTTGRDATAPEARHWLSYPVTNHSVKPWGRDARLPNTLRFKIRLRADGKLVGIIFHMPHMPVQSFLLNRHSDSEMIKRVWRQVHTFLDAEDQGLTRSAE